MRLFLDTSALIKKYIHEKGSEKVDDLLSRARTVIVSAITEIEACSTFRRLLAEKAISGSDYKTLMNEFETDFPYFTRIVFDEFVSSNAKLVIEKHQLKTLDSIQLGTALMLKSEFDNFVACDSKLIRAGRKEGLRIINPIA